MTTLYLPFVHHGDGDYDPGAFDSHLSDLLPEILNDSGDLKPGCVRQFLKITFEDDEIKTVEIIDSEIYAADHARECWLEEQHRREIASPYMSGRI